MTIQEVQRKLYERLKPSGWANKLKSFLLSDEFTDILTVLYKSSQNKNHFTPVLKNVFRAFEECPYGDLKVVFIETEPYSQSEIADGLAFSCSNGQPTRKVLEHIFDDIERYAGKNINRDPDLKRWANQGVLLLNTSMTCEIDKPGTHIELWEPFIYYLFNVLSSYNPGTLYIYMGTKSRKWINEIPSEINYKFIPSHPITASYVKNGYWDSGDLFTKINDIIRKNNRTEIIW